MSDGWNDAAEAVASLEIDSAPRETVDPRAGNEEYIKNVAEKGWAQTTETAATVEEPAWLADAAKYEWRGEIGDVCSRNEALEAELYKSEFIMKTGEDLDAFREFEVTVAGPKQFKPVRQFEDAGLHPVMLENIKLCGFKTPTPIQSYCIPLGLQAHDIKAVAQTGSGKTAAYLIPILSRLMGRADELAAPKPYELEPEPARVVGEPLVVVVVPSRELALQVFDESRRLCYRSMLRPCVTFGKFPLKNSIADITQGCDILIATPGRLCDLMEKPDVLSMRRVKFTVLDEADEMLRVDWDPQLRQIMSGGDNSLDDDHNFMMFSATFPPAAVELAADYLDEAHYDICVGRSGSTHRNIKQDIIWVDHELKLQALYDLLMSMTPCRVLIFCNFTRSADQVDDFLYNRGFNCNVLHSNRSQAERELALKQFRRGQAKILIGTAVTARGLDISGIEHVVNYELPSSQYGGIDEYVHRIGRTARIGNKGNATSFYNERDEALAQDLTNILLESQSEIPDFLKEHVHEDGKAHFEEPNNTDFEAAAEPAGESAEKAEETVATDWGTSVKPSEDDSAATW